MASNRPVNSANRVKSITNRFEGLNENTEDHKNYRGVKKTSNDFKEFGIQRTLQCQLNDTVLPIRGTSLVNLNSNNSGKDKFGPSCNFGNRKRLKEMNETSESQIDLKLNNKLPVFEALHRNQKPVSDASFSRLEYKPSRFLPERTKSEGGSEKSFRMADNAIKDVSENKSLSRQFSDPSRKLQRTPAFRCDRSEKLKDSRNNSVSSCDGSADEIVQNENKTYDRSALTRDKLKKLGALLEVKMKEDNFEFSVKSKKNGDIDQAKLKSTLFNVDIVPILVDKSVNGGDALSPSSFPCSVPLKIDDNQVAIISPVVDDGQIPQHILDQYAKVIKPRNKNAFIKKSPEHNLKADTVLSDSGVSSESENLISDDLDDCEVSSKIKTFKSLRDNYEGKSFGKRDESAGRRKQLKRSVEENINKLQDSDVDKRDTLTNVPKQNDRKSVDSLSEFIRNNGIESCNDLTDTLKKVLKQPLPPGPPPKKPPRTFATTGSDITSPPKTPIDIKRRVKDGKIIKSPKQHRTKEESKLMLDKIENALIKHEKGVKVLSPRPVKKNGSNISDSEDSPSRMSTQPSTALLKRLSKEKTVPVEAKPKEIHYMCTEIFDLNYSDKENILNSSDGSLNSSDGKSSSTIKQCFNSFNCSSTSRVSNGYRKFGSFPGSKRTSLTDSCCPCSTSDKAPSRCSVAEDYTSQNLILSTFCSPVKNSDSSKCKKCGYNEKKIGQFQCHIGCTCSIQESSHDSSNKEESNSTFFVERSPEIYAAYGALKKSKSQEHIYAEPFQLLASTKNINSDEKNISNAEKEYNFHRTASVYSAKPAFRRTSTQLEDGFKIRNRESIVMNPFRKSFSSNGMEYSLSIKDKADNFDTTADITGSKEKVISDTSVKRYSFEKEGFKSLANDVPTESSSRVKDILMRLEGNRRSLKVTSYRNSADDQTNFVDASHGDNTGLEDKRRSSWRKSKSVGDFENSYPAKNPNANGLHYMSTKIYDIPCTDDQPSHSPTPPTLCIPEIEHIELIPPSSFLYGLQNGRSSVQNCAQQPTILETTMKPPIYERNNKGEGFLNSIRPKRPDNLQLGDSRISGKTARLIRQRRSSPTEADRNQLSRLMTEIYDTVAEACTLDSPGKEEETMLGEKEDRHDAEASLKLTRTLTEKRKRYLRRVSSRVGYANPPIASLIPPKASPEIYESFDMTDSAISAYATFPSSRLHSLKNQSENLYSKTESASVDNEERVTENNSMGDDSSKKMDSVVMSSVEQVKEDRLFDACVLVGMNYSTGKAYIKSVYPEKAPLPSRIESLVFPETYPTHTASAGNDADRQRVSSSPSIPSDPCNVQCYSLVLTDERGVRSYGYCRRVLPEGAPFCLPLAYCLLARRRAPGFYYKVLEEIESLHGSSDVVFDSILNQLYSSKLPRPNHSITIKQLRSPRRIIYQDSIANNGANSFQKNSTYRRSLNLEELVKNTEEKNDSFKVKDLNNYLSPNTEDSINRRRKSTDFTETFSLNQPSNVYRENCDLSVMLSLEKLYGKDLKEFRISDNYNDQSVVNNSKSSSDHHGMDEESLKVNNLVIEEIRKISNSKSSSSVSNSSGKISLEDICQIRNNIKSPSNMDTTSNNSFQREIGSQQDMANDIDADATGNMNTVKVINLKRPWEPRLDEDNLSILLDTISVGVLVKVFGTLLLERKVILICDKLSRLSACIEALQSILYPFIWQHTLISIIPSELRRDILEAPIPILAGLLIDSKKSSEKQSKSKSLPAGTAFLKHDAKNSSFDDLIRGLNFEEGMLIDITNCDGNSPAEKVLLVQGDEATLLPPLLAKTLKAALHIGPPISSSLNPSDDHTRKTRNVLIAEAFLRFFVDLLRDYNNFLKEKFSPTSTDVTGQIRNFEFERENFIKSAQSKHVQYFLDWFTETAMFRHFIEQSTSTPIAGNLQNASDHHLPYPDYYDVFREKISQRNDDDCLRRSGCKSAGVKGSGNNLSKGNYKVIMNKKVKVWRDKLRDLVN